MKHTKLYLIMAVVALGLLFTNALHAQDLTGNWQGTLEAGRGLRIILKVSKGADGQLAAKIYSIDQGARPMDATSIAISGNTVNFAVKPIEFTYTGTLAADGNSISGKATQGDQTHALNLQRVTAEAMWAIPEPPKPMPADAKPKFDVITVKPSDPNRPGKLFTVRGRHVMTINTDLNDIITFAYGLHVKQIIGGPDWLATEKFDIDGVPDVEGQPSADQLRLLLRDALEQRFAFKFHRDEKELTAYTLTVAKGGPKMKVTEDKPSDSRNFLYRKPGELRVTNSTMKDFCDGLQGSAMDKPVVDRTGLTERYDFNLSWTPDDSQFIQLGWKTPPPTDEASAPPSIYTALQEQLGLKMEATKTSVPVFVIDHVERPSAN